MSSYEITEMNGHQALHLRTATRAGLVSGSFEGMFEIMAPALKDAEGVAGERQIAVSGKDFSDLFHRLLNEAIVLGKAHGEAYEGIKLTLITETEAKGALLVREVTSRKKDIAAAALVGGAVAKNEAGLWDVTIEFADGA